ASFADLNDWLATRCRELAQRKHPGETSQRIAECFAREQPHLRAISAPFDGYVEQMLRVSSTCLVRVDRNRYSVPAEWAGKAVSVRCSATEVRIVADAQVVAEHPRRFGRDQLICDPWHYLPVLEKKPGALRNGAPFVAWELPSPIQQVRERLLKQPRGDRAFVELLLIARAVGLEPLQVACELALECGVVTGSLVMNELRRLTAPARPPQLTLPEQLQLRVEPLADCQRYEQLRGTHHVH
ncbi:IS21 family transposase, partial [Pseudomonas sp. CrR25]|nr:IS21 family transposase [Pseudomonas sp. CrR25]